MPNIGAVLKDEITRLARKAIKEQVAPLHAAAARQRAQISALKKEVQQLHRQVTLQERQLAKKGPSEPAVEEGGYRFTSQGFASMRQRLGLSAQDLGRLIGVDQKTIYAWEGDKSKPRRSYLPAIAKLRKVGKREAQRLLAALPEA